MYDEQLGMCERGGGGGGCVGPLDSSWVKGALDPGSGKISLMLNQTPPPHPSPPFGRPQGRARGRRPGVAPGLGLGLPELRHRDAAARGLASREEGPGAKGYGEEGGRGLRTLAPHPLYISPPPKATVGHLIIIISRHRMTSN